MLHVHDTMLSELRRIWHRYDPQREAERSAIETGARAAKELHELNQRRLAAGLQPVGEYREQSLQGIGGIAQGIMYPVPAKTWRDHMDEELLSCVRKWLEESETGK